MRICLTLCVALLLGLSLIARQTPAAEATATSQSSTPAAGDAAATAAPAEPVDFRLPDYYGRERSLAELADRKLVVLVFLGTDCPLVKLYAPRLAQLVAEFESKGVAFVGINSNRQDALTKIAQIARQQQISFPILKDRDHALADRLGATRTPEVFVLDVERKVRYQGRIDDQYSVGVQRREARTHELAAAIGSLLAGEAVTTPRTEAPGCLIGRAPRTAPHGDVTFSNQIVRIFNNRCVSCHRPGEVGPFALTSYEEAAGWAGMIREVVDERRMPPLVRRSRAWSLRERRATDRRRTDGDPHLGGQWRAGRQSIRPARAAEVRRGLADSAARRRLLYA